MMTLYVRNGRVETILLFLPLSRSAGSIILHSLSTSILTDLRSL